MPKVKNLFLVFILVIAFKTSHAGWYECYNYKGTIGKANVSFTIQVREGYFGEPTKKEFNINVGLI